MLKRLKAGILKLEWHQLYYILAIIDILTILAALSLTQLLMTTYEESVYNNRLMSSSVGEFTKLGFIAQGVNEPGNRIFETKDPVAERQALRQSVVWFNTAFSRAQSNLGEVFTSEQQQRIRQETEKLKQSMKLMVSESEMVFLAVEQNDLVLAGKHMSAMDAHYYQATQAIGDVSQYISDIQNLHFIDQIAEAKAIKRYEIVISIVVLLIITLVTVYGHKLGKRLKANSQAIQESLLAAQQSSKAKEMFLANMSHEIRTPMNAVLGMLKLINTEKLDKEDRRYLKLASSSADNLLIIINDILNFSKSEQNQITLEYVTFDINALISEQVELYQHANKQKNINLVCDNNKVDQNWLKGDSSRLIQVLNNLLNNAYKFTHEGSITVIIETIALDTEVKLTLKVKDTGIGIPSDKLTSIFDVFTQADVSTTRKYGGTGLGLAISKRICQLMGGDLEASSEINEGSCFTASFSMLEANESEVSAIKEHKAIETTDDLKPLNLHLLVAEDNRVNQILIKKLLDKMGCSYDIASDGEQAIKLLSDKHQAILMDCLMPNLDGFEATQKIKASGKFEQLPIIAVTANSMPEDRQKCFNAGMTGYVSKPIEFAELYKELAKVARAR